MRLIDANELERVAVTVDGRLVVYLTDIHNAPTVELDEGVIQEVLNKRCMTAVANEYLVALHGGRPQGKWILHKDYNERKYGCNQCGNLNNIPSKFCPNCGAKMDGGAEE